MANAIRVLQVTPFFAPAWRYGGPIQTVLRLCQALQGAGVEVEVATTNCDGRSDLDVIPGVLQSYEGVRVRYFRRWPRVDYAFSPGLARFLASSAARFDLVHINSTFSFPALAGGTAARRAGVPYVVSPHGSLLRWSLAQKRWKKRPYWAVLERRHLARAAAIHATAPSELEDVTAVLPSAEVFVVPNGMEEVSVPAVPRHPRRIVFLGRIHPKKGFDVLVPALARVARQLPGVETLVAGPDDVGEWPRVERLLSDCHPRPCVRYLGPVNGTARFALLAGAAAFVLPSHSENFGMTVLEAMACGTPVVVSRGCPWEEVERRGAGAWVENEPAAIAEALLRILRDPGAVEHMGSAGRLLASGYGWPSIARAMRERYETIVASRRARR